MFWETNNFSSKRSLILKIIIFSPGERPAQTSSVKQVDTARHRAGPDQSIARPRSPLRSVAAAPLLPRWHFWSSWSSTDSGRPAMPTCRPDRTAQLSSPVRRRRKKAAPTSHRVTACRAMAGAAPLVCCTIWSCCSSPTAPSTPESASPSTAAMDAKRVAL